MNMLVEKDLCPAIAGPRHSDKMRTVSEESQIAQDYTEDNFEFLESRSEMREKLKRCEKGTGVREVKGER